MCVILNTIMDKDAIKLLEQINNSLTKINVREESNEMMSDTHKFLDKSDRRVENSLDQIQNTFDRIHDKIFNFNNVLIGAFLVLGTFPNNAPHLKLWTIIFPIINMVFMIYIDYRQMEIHRFAAGEQDWTTDERNEYGNKINKQTTLSLFSLFLSLLCLLYLIIKVM
ncbi:hypothetical protein E0I61_07670 [Flavobacterium ranwuense]|uniref:Uncharacterized protein n=1 Tax=Flavobacterium ranwuense TaxID=2541725 RepID=A0ABY2DTA7_9FLAO|nr:hypothetical protein [Flavobacterium ranwuense]TDE29840.1 hypothetical protein E0I61_07670 [Flavobacterium ranwuense]